MWGSRWPYRRHRLGLGAVVGAVVLVSALVGLPVATAAVVVNPTGVFELDGNILPSTGVDWQNTATSAPNNGFFDATHNVTGPVSPLPPNFTNAKFVQDFVAGNTSDTTTFTNGSADTADVSGWSCVGVHNVTDKGDITNTYVTAYRDPTTDHLVLMFGIEKNASNGDNNVAVWLLHDGTVGCNNTTIGGSGVSFSGHHQDGDVLLAAAFTNGGTTPTVKAYLWHGGASGSIDSTADASGTKCGSSSDARLCAITNVTQQLSPPWPTSTKTGTGVPPLQFYEGGADITALTGQQCFASYLADTRASQSTGSALYDFATTSFPTCGPLHVKKYIDTNQNGTRDTGEPAGANWAFTVNGPASGGGPGPQICTGTTNSSGDLVCATGSLDSLPPGDYKITETQTTGFLNTDPGAIPATPDYFNTATTITKTVTKPAGDTTVYFGNACTIGYTFEVDNVPAGKQVFVNYNVTAGHDATTTFPTGTISPITPNATTHVATATQTFVSNDVLTWTWGFTDDTTHTVSGATGVHLNSSAILASCAASNSSRFTPATIIAHKYKDKDGDKTLNKSVDTAISGFTFQLKQGTTVIDTKSSQSNGSITFSNVIPGTYTIHETSIPTGWTQTLPSSGGDYTVTIALGDGTVTTDQSGATLDFLNTPLSDFGLSFTSEGKLPGTTTDATKSTIHCTDTNGQTVPADSTNGTYAATGVVAGTYSCTVTIVDP